MAKEDVQVITEEHEDEYWMKPLREAIVNIGNSWAGGIVRKQHYANEYATNAANRAHEAYLAQMNNQSTERVAGARLGVDIARYKTLDKQHKETMDIKKQVEAREDERWAVQKQDQENEVAATQAVNKLYADYERFKLDDQGNVILEALDPDKRRALENQMALSPAINTKFKTPLMQRKARRQKIAGRMQMLKQLQEEYGNESVISHILHQTGASADPNSIAKIQVSGREGEPGYDNLQALGKSVSDDETWSQILDSYGVDSVTVPKLKEFEKKYAVAHGKMINHTELNKNHFPFDATDNYQIARTESYHDTIDKLSKPFNPVDKDNTALMAAINNLDIGFQGLAKNTTDILSASAIRFMQKEGVYFTAPDVLMNRIRDRITKVAQHGPDASFASKKVTIESGKNKGQVQTVKGDLPDDIDHSLHALMFGEGDLSQKRVHANELLRAFVKAEGWHKESTKGIQSVVEGKKRKEFDNDFSIGSIFDNDENVYIADEDTALQNNILMDMVQAPIQDQSYDELSANSMISTPVTIETLRNNPMFEGFTKVFDYFTGKAMNGLENGKIKAMGPNATDIKKMPIKDWQTMVFSGRTDDPEYAFFTKQLNAMKQVASKRAGGKDIDEYWNSVRPANAPAVEEERNTFNNLRQLYDTNQKIAEQQMLQRPDLFFNERTGEPLAWMRQILGQSKDAPMDWGTIEKGMDEADASDKVRTSWEYIFASLGIPKDAKDDGTYFGIGHRLRRLAESAMPEHDPSRPSTPGFEDKSGKVIPYGQLNRPPMFFHSSGKTFRMGNKQFSNEGY